MTLDAKCDCGDVHEFRAETRSELEMIILTYGPVIEVALGEHAWLVPRIWIAAHGLRGFELPDLAAKYGWAPVH